MPTKLSTIEIDMSQLEDALRRAEKKLDEKDYAILRAVVDAYDTITELVDDKNTTIARLRKLLFGSRTEKTKTVIGGGKDSESPRSASAAVSTAVVVAPRKRLPKDTAATGPTPTPGRRRLRCLTSRSSRAIPARSATRARCTRRVGPACWCGW